MCVCVCVYGGGGGMESEGLEKSNNLKHILLGVTFSPNVYTGIQDGEVLAEYCDVRIVVFLCMGRREGGRGGYGGREGGREEGREGGKGGDRW